MSLDEFEKHYRDSMSDALNKLQRVTLLSSNLQESLEEISVSLQKLNQTTEEFINYQRQNSDESAPESWEMFSCEIGVGGNFNKERIFLLRVTGMMGLTM